MPFALLLIGVLLVVTGARDTHVQLGRQVTKDFTGQGNFTYWMLAIALIGAMGYSDTLRPLSRMFLALVVVSVLLANPQFWSNLSNAIKQGPITPEKVVGSSSADAVKKNSDSLADHAKQELETLKSGTSIFTWIFSLF